MTTNDAGRTQTVYTQIDALERRLAANRNQLAADLTGFAQKLRAQVVAPSSILAAVAVGVIIEQGSRHRTWSFALVLQGLGLANRLVGKLGALSESLKVGADE